MLIKDGSELKSTKITIPAGGTKEITYTARLRPSELGKEVKNTARIYSSESKTYKYAEASSSTNAKKTITIASSTGVTDKYNVILVLDRSWSETLVFDKIKDAARGLVNELEDTNLKKENITKKYISFGATSTPIDSINEYTRWSLGGTNYNAALIDAIKATDSSKKNIVVFMSDGCPTSTLIPTFGELVDWVQEKTGWGFLEKFEESLLGKAVSKGYDLIVSVANTVTGGWLELQWIGENEYGFSLLVTGGKTWPDWIQKFLDDWGKKSAAKIVWDEIMEKVSILKNEKKVEKFYTIYYCSDLDSKKAEYGLKKMATDESYYYLASNTDKLKEVFKKIGEDMIPEATAERKESYMTNTIILDSGIKQIKINGTEIDFSTYVKDIGEGKCELDISNWLGAKDIEIIY